MDRPTSLNLKYVAILTVVASLILVAGALLRPGARSSEQAPPSDTDLARLARLTERRTLESAAAFLSQVADDVSPALVWLERPGTTGVAWNEGTIVTARIGLPAETVAQVVVASAEGVESTAGIDWSPDLPAAGVRVVTGAIQPPRPVAPTRSGDPLLIVWKTSAGRMFAAADFADVVETTCGDLPSREVHTTMEATRAMAGGGLFDLDGNLLGVILPCGDRYAAVVPDAVDGMLATVESFASRLLARYGMAVEPLTEEEVEYFDVASGAIVRELRAGSPAAAAGLQPGDIIVALDGAPVAGTDDLRALAAPTALP
ncbi:MAG TPA: PDZ domain-containing protein, partial [Vicinamibacterales bacterium]|nr:PDZ domain-containing protein [Vicinamibacterales bacterium]